jgi:hypothetical protein
MRLLVEAQLLVEVDDSTSALDEALFVRDMRVELPFGAALSTELAVTRLIDASARRCDFCSQPGPVFEYECEDFVVDAPSPMSGVEEGMVGSWLACIDCSRCIELNSFDELTQRSLAHMPRAIRRDMRPYVSILQRQFKEHRKGPRIALEEKESKT